MHFHSTLVAAAIHRQLMSEHLVATPAYAMLLLITSNVKCITLCPSLHIGTCVACLA